MIDMLAAATTTVFEFLGYGLAAWLVWVLTRSWHSSHAETHAWRRVLAAMVVIAAVSVLLTLYHVAIHALLPADSRSVAGYWRERWWWIVLSHVSYVGGIAAVCVAIRARHQAHAAAVALQRADAARIRAELAGLRAHVRPDFMSTVLRAVRDQVTHRPMQAERLLEQLGDLLHYVLQLDRRRVSSADALVLLDEEWRAAQSFLKLIEATTDTALDVEDDIGPARFVQVPPYVLLPVLDYVIGLAREESGMPTVRLAVSSECDDTTCRLRVSAAAQVASQSLSTPDSRGGVFDGDRSQLPSRLHGLRVIWSRLAAHDAAATLRVQHRRTHQGILVNAHVSIPIACPPFVAATA